MRGTDEDRVGPVRLVAGGLAPARDVKAAAFYAFGVAAVAGLVLALFTTPWLIVVGLVSVAAGWFYTGGPRPYGYAGFGELFVFVFFGLVAVVGTAYVSLGHVTALAIVAAVPVGLLSTALLVVNNLRDIEGDRHAGKSTLAVRMGDPATRRLYAACILGSFVFVLVVAIWTPGALIALAAAVVAVPPLRLVGRGATGRDLVTALVGTSRLQIAFGVLLAVGIVL